MTIEIQLIQATLQTAFEKSTKVEGLEKLLEKASKTQEGICKQMWTDNQATQQKIMSVQSDITKIDKSLHEAEEKLQQASRYFGREIQKIAPTLLQRYPDLTSSAMPSA
jgi:septation ring formation regulator EzrA